MKDKSQSLASKNEEADHLETKASLGSYTRSLIQATQL
jgi:hypothetical protein